jgi:hypothetical protein
LIWAYLHGETYRQFAGLPAGGFGQFPPAVLLELVDYPLGHLVQPAASVADRSVDQAHDDGS